MKYRKTNFSVPLLAIIWLLPLILYACSQKPDVVYVEVTRDINIEATRESSQFFSGEKPPNSTNPNSTQSAGLSNVPECLGAEFPLLSIGKRAIVSWDKVNLRSTPEVPQDFYENIITELTKGDKVTVVSGPTCAHEGYWWEIRTDSGYTGWMRESTETKILLAPIP